MTTSTTLAASQATDESLRRKAAIVRKSIMTTTSEQRNGRTIQPCDTSFNSDIILVEMKKNNGAKLKKET